jgi:hypothetical protein
VTTDLCDELRDAMHAETVHLLLAPNAAGRALRGVRRRRRRQVVTVITTVTVLATAGVGLAAFDGGAPQRLQTVDPGVASSGPAPQQLHDAVIAALFPASGADFTLDATQGLGAFEAAVAQRAIADCMRARGEGYPASPPVAPHISDFPDLGVIAAQGLSGPPVQGEPAGSAISVCEHAAQSDPTTKRALLLRRDGLSDVWMREATAVDHDPRVVDAYRSFGPCARAHGVPVETEQAFFGYADGHGQRTAGAEQFRRLDLRLAQVYASCMQPIESVRTALRSQLRDEFLQQHSAQLAAIEKETADEVAQIEHDTGVGWPS